MLRWLIFANVPFPKSPYSSVKRVVYFYIINLVGNYIMVNELKSPYEEFFKKKFNVHVKKIKIEIHPKMIMILTYKNMVLFKPFKCP